jgi:hypothetical protein
LLLNISRRRADAAGVNDALHPSAVNGLMLMYAPQADNINTTIMSEVRVIILRNMIGSP